jgi:hypothetical protein
LRNAENGWSEEEAGMAQLDDDIGLVMQKIKDLGEDDNTTLPAIRRAVIAALLNHHPPQRCPHCRIRFQMISKSILPK